MCLCFSHVYPKFYRCGSITKSIQKMIPEFNRKTLGATTPKNCRAWWHCRQDEFRIKAFDKLIEIYERED